MMNSQFEHRESWLNRIQSTWGLGLACSLGLEDAMNVNTLALTLLFFFFLVYIVRTRKNVIFCGLLCMAIQLIALTALIHGKFDSFLTQEAVYRYVRIFCGILGLIFIIVGLIYFRDWWQQRIRGSNQKLWIVLPMAVTKNDTSEGFFIIGLFVSLFYWILSVVFGAVIIFLSSYALQDYAMFIMLIDSISKNKLHLGQQAVVVYATAYLIPGIMLWVLAIVYSFSENFRKYIERSISIVKIILSSIFLSFGIGLLVTFYAM